MPDVTVSGEPAGDTAGNAQAWFGREADAYEAGRAAERRAIAEVFAPWKARRLADLFELIDVRRGVEGETEVQDDLRKLADMLGGGTDD